MPETKHETDGAKEMTTPESVPDPSAGSPYVLPPKKKVGRKGKLNTVRDKFLDFIRKGNYIDTSAKACGIDPRTVYYWLERGESEGPSGEYFQFFLDLHAARAEAETRLLQIIEDAAPKSWQAAAWMLRHIDPVKYSDQPTLEIKQTITTTAQEVKEPVDPDRIAAILNVLSGVGIVPSVVEVGGTGTNYRP